MCNRPGGVPALIFLLRSPAPKPKNRTDQSYEPECEKRYAPGTTAAAPSKRAAACSAIESDQEITKEPIEISLNPYVSRLVTVDALVGHETLKLLFDTGGVETSITPDVARRLGCIPSGRSVGFRMTGEMVESQYCHDISLSIGGVSFHHERIVVWDVNKILPEDLPRLDGILSLKTFLDQPFTIDLSSKHLILETKESLEDRTSTMTRLESRIATGPNGNELTIFLQGKIREFRNYGWFLSYSCAVIDDCGPPAVFGFAPNVGRGRRVTSRPDCGAALSAAPT